MTSQLNILEKLTENFVELNEDIETIQNEIADHYKTNDEFNKEIKELQEKQSELLEIIKEKETKKERLMQIYNTTEENFNQVQQAAQSLLEILATKNDSN